MQRLVVLFLFFALANGAVFAAALPPLDQRLERIKTRLWLDDAQYPQVAPGEQGYIHLLTRSADDSVELLELTLVVDDQQYALKPTALISREAPYPGYQWWVLPAPAVGSDSALLYTVTQKRSNTPTAEGVFSLPTDKADYSKRFEMVLEPGITGDASVTLIEWRSTEEASALLQFFFRIFLPWGSYQVRYVAPGSADDMATRFGQNQCAGRQPYSGLKVLLDLEQRYNQQKTETYWLSRARCALNAGLRTQAEEAMAKAAQMPTDDNEPWYRMMLQIAEADFQRRQPERALHILEQIRPDMPASVRLEWRDLTSRVLLALDQNTQAVDTLLALDPYANQNWAEYSDRGRKLAFVRYNLAIGLLREGYTLDGYSILDLLGLSLESDFDLANQANLLLGWHFLRQEQGLNAGKALHRISLEGPRANRGLLAYGWSFLAAPGDQLERPDTLAGDDVYHSISPVAVQDLYRKGFLACQDFNRLSLLRIEACPTGETWSGRYFRELTEADSPESKAIVAWSELVDRDARDPAVAEGRLALAGTYAKLGDFAEGQAQLATLLQDIAAALNALSAAQQEIISGSFLAELLREQASSEIGWWWEPAAVPATDAGFFLYDWLAQHRSVALLQTIRDTRLLWQAVTSGTQHTDPGYRPQNPLIQMEAAAKALFVAEATQQLSEVGSLMQRYQVAALLLQVELAEAAERRAAQAVQ